MNLSKEADRTLFILASTVLCPVYTSATYII